MKFQGRGKCLKSEALGTPCKEAGRHCQGSVVATAHNDYSFCVRKANSCFLGLRNKHIFCSGGMHAGITLAAYINL